MKKYRVQILLLLTFLLATCTPQAKPTEVITPTSTPVTFAFGPQTADEAQELLTQAEQLILNREKYSEYGSQIYLSAEYAAWEALDHFPSDSHVETWKWKLAYYAILSGDTGSASDVYLDLIAKALNEKKITIEDLPSWFQSGKSTTDSNLTPPFELHIENPLKNKQGDQYLVELGVSGSGSEALCYLLRKSSKEYSVSLAYDGLSQYGYSTGSYNSTGCELKDVTNDGLQDLIVGNYYGAHLGYSTTQVFDLSTLPPKPLPFANTYGENTYKIYDYVNDYPISNGKNQIQIVKYLGQQWCNNEAERIYEWNGKQFNLVTVNLRLDAKNSPLPNCWGSLSREAQDSGIRHGVEILDKTIEAYRPYAISYEDKQTLDELRVEKALLYLFYDQPDKALTILKEVEQNPYQKNGAWIKPIRGFLKAYKTQADTYRAWSTLMPCVSNAGQAGKTKATCFNDDYELAFAYVRGHIPLSLPLEKLTEYFKNSGVDIASQGWVDFDQDGKNELWFMVSSPANKLAKQNDNQNEYLIYVVSGYPNGTKIFFVDFSPVDAPGFEIVKMDENSVSIRYGQIIWSRDSLTDEPSLQNTTYTSMENKSNKMMNLQARLLKKDNVYQVYAEYLNIKEGYASCPLEDSNFEYRCGVYYYDLGFAAELAGDEKTAREMYSIIVEQYPDHPMALLAKNKLKK